MASQRCKLTGKKKKKEKYIYIFFLIHPSVQRHRITTTTAIPSAPSYTYTSIQQKNIHNAYASQQQQHSVRHRSTTASHSTPSFAPAAFASSKQASPHTMVLLPWCCSAAPRTASRPRPRSHRVRRVVGVPAGAHNWA